MYDVVLLVEQELTEPDAQRVVALHEEMPDTVKYHVVVPCDNAEVGMESSLSALGTADLYGAGVAEQREGLAEAQKVMDEEAKDGATRSVERLRGLGQEADGSVTHDRPVDAVIELVKKVDGQEVIILTQPHLVAEFFHVDWSASARRHLGVPVLHLLEHENETAD